MEKDQKMAYKYTIYITDEEERIKTIAEEILVEYPRLGVIAEKIAKMERPFGPAYEDYSAFSDQENHINRLIDIIIVTEGKDAFKDEYEKACNDLKAYYRSWMRCFAHAKPEEQPVYLVVQSFIAHQRNNSFPILTFAQAVNELQRRNTEQRLNESAGRLRAEIPQLEEVADQVAYIQSTYNKFLRLPERDLSNLVLAVKLIEDKFEFASIYPKVINTINSKYSEWLNEYGNDDSFAKEKEILAEMMQRLKNHLNGENVEISSYFDIEKEFEKNSQRLTRC